MKLLLFLLIILLILAALLSCCTIQQSCYKPIHTTKRYVWVEDLSHDRDTLKFHKYGYYNKYK